MHQIAAGIIKSAIQTNLSRVHVGIAGKAGASEALALNLTCSLDPLGDDTGRLSQAEIGQFLIIHPGHIHMDINAVQQGTGDAMLILCDR